MAVCILYRRKRERRPRYYRVEIAYNLFNEISVMREWGITGGKGRAMVNIYGNLRDASDAADIFRNRAMKRGYARNDRAVIPA
ncbi:WGR domain-containing protein [Shimia gijangensis]|uniref:WGR domain-containing protein n=1 Tax=Shimia gijangensis TaxID=1470563 RepID=A0A1M6NLS4_9RHOB|nr:WGR domain-containing protein [Shimia gijangensis]SHJ96554.1 WGR domain-containing protein [Shimia gijangensis]